MPGRWLPIALLALCVVPLAGHSVEGGPTVGISSPPDGSVSLNHDVLVNGTSSGTVVEWQQGNGTALAAGTAEGVVVDASGSVLLARRFSDDFDDGSLDPVNWTVYHECGLSAVEEDGTLHLNGTSDVIGPWCSYVMVLSNTAVEYCQATLESFLWTGDGSFSGLFLLWDNDNYIGICTWYEPVWVGEGARTVIYVRNGGSESSYNLGRTDGKAHTYLLASDGEDVSLLLDGTPIGSYWYPQSNPRALLMAKVRDEGESVDAVWDDFCIEYFPSGNYTSTVLDTGCDPPVLTMVGWDATIPTNATLAVEVRSSDASDMGSPTEWAPVSDGQTADLPPVRRYIQYRACLGTTDGLGTPTVSNMTMRYLKAIAKVEVSIDEMASWTYATGTTDWYAMLDLPEDGTRVWARATDTSGESNVTSIMVNVDTTPPTGSVTINGDEPFTTTVTVELSLLASDSYGISKMKVGNSPGLGDAEWTDHYQDLDWTLLPGEGPKTVYAAFMDRNGLVSSIVSDTIALDMLPPVGTIAIDDGARYTNAAMVTLALHADDVSSVVEVLLSESPSFEGAQWVSYEESMAYALSATDGPKTVYAKFKDQTGHASESVNASIILDTVAPMVSVTIDGGTAYTRSRTLTVDLAFFHEGPIGQMQVGFNPMFFGVPQEPVAARKSLTAPDGEGPTTVYARAWDEAGNVGPTASASITVDTVPPTLDLTINGGAAYANTTLVSLEFVPADDILVVMLEVAEDASFAQPTTHSVISMLPWTLPPGEGRKVVYARATDAAGNIGATVSASIILDTVPPSLDIAVTADANVTRTTEVALTLDASDASGVVEMQLSGAADYTGVTPIPYAGTTVWNLSLGDGMKTVHARVRDGAGNWGPTATTMIALDTTPPTVQLSAERPSEGREDIKLSWQGSDALSGVGTFDLQVRDGKGAWTTWMAGTTLTSTTYPGRFGHTYYFRARATDMVGNAGAFPDGPADVAEVSVATPPTFLERGSSYLLIAIVIAIAVAVVAGYYLRGRPRQA